MSNSNHNSQPKKTKAKDKAALLRQFEAHNIHAQHPWLEEGTKPTPEQRDVVSELSPEELGKPKHLYGGLALNRNEKSILIKFLRIRESMTNSAGKALPTTNLLFQEVRHINRTTETRMNHYVFNDIYNLRGSKRKSLPTKPNPDAVKGLSNFLTSNNYIHEVITNYAPRKVAYDIEEFKSYNDWEDTFSSPSRVTIETNDILNFIQQRKILLISTIKRLVEEIMSDEMYFPLGLAKRLSPQLAPSEFIVLDCSRVVVKDCANKANERQTTGFKISLHIIFPTLFLPPGREFETRIYKHVLNGLSLVREFNTPTFNNHRVNMKFDSVLDPAMCKDQKSLRCLYSCPNHDYDKKHPLVVLDEPTCQIVGSNPSPLITDTLVTCVPPYVSQLHTLLSSIKNDISNELEEEFVHTASGTRDDSISDDKLRNLYQALLARHDMFRAFTPEGVGRTSTLLTLSLKRRLPSYCILCDREHDKIDGLVTFIPVENVRVKSLDKTTTPDDHQTRYRIEYKCWRVTLSDKFEIDELTKSGEKMEKSFHGVTLPPTINIDSNWNIIERPVELSVNPMADNLTDIFKLDNQKSCKISDGFDVDLSNRETWVVRAGTGTGKTVGIINMIKNVLDTRVNDRPNTVIFISFRLTFTENVYNRMREEGIPLHAYNKEWANKGMIDSDCLIIQVDSIMRLDIMYYSETNLILICDELNAIMTQMMGLAEGRRQSVMERFGQLLKMSQVCLMLDAYMRPDHFDTICEIRIDSEMHSVCDDTPSDADKVFYVYETITDLLFHILTSVRDGIPIMIACGTKMDAYILYMLFINVCGVDKDKIAKYTGDDKGKFKSEDLTDTDKSWADKMVVIYTSTINAGVHCTLERFKIMYGFFRLFNSHLSGEETMQMMKRNRAIREFHVCIFNKGQSPFDAKVSFKEYREEQMKRIAPELTGCGNMSTVRDVIENDAYLKRMDYIKTTMSFILLTEFNRLITTVDPARILIQCIELYGGEVRHVLKGSVRSNDILKWIGMTIKELDDYINESKTDVGDERAKKVYFEEDGDYAKNHIINLYYPRYPQELLDDILGMSFIRAYGDENDMRMMKNLKLVFGPNPYPRVIENITNYSMKVGSVVQSTLIYITNVTDEAYRYMAFHVFCWLIGMRDGPFSTTIDGDKRMNPISDKRVFGLYKACITHLLYQNGLPTTAHTVNCKSKAQLLMEYEKTIKKILSKFGFKVCGKLAFNPKTGGFGGCKVAINPKFGISPPFGVKDEIVRQNEPNEKMVNKFYSELENIYLRFNENVENFCLPTFEPSLELLDRFKFGTYETFVTKCAVILECSTQNKEYMENRCADCSVMKRSERNELGSNIPGKNCTCDSVGKMVSKEPDVSRVYHSEEAEVFMNELRKELDPTCEYDLNTGYRIEENGSRGESMFGCLDELGYLRVEENWYRDRFDERYERAMRLLTEHFRENRGLWPGHVVDEEKLSGRMLFDHVRKVCKKSKEMNYELPYEHSIVEYTRGKRFETPLDGEYFERWLVDRLNRDCD